MLPSVTFAAHSRNSDHISKLDSNDKYVINLKYDDRYYVGENSVVTEVSPGICTSYQVGYNIPENTLDTAVVTYDKESNKLIATGVGTTTVVIDGEKYTVKVSPAPISLFLLIGQSNMEGAYGDSKKSIANEDGQVYSSYGASFPDMSNRSTCIPSALTGPGCTITSSGSKVSYPINALTESGNGKAGMDSSIAYEWTKLTGEKVWLVNTSAVGSSIDSWLPTSNVINYNSTANVFRSVRQTLEAEINAGHYILSHMGYFWCQGCTDNLAQMDAHTYLEKYLLMHNALTSTDFSITVKNGNNTVTKTMEFGGIVLVLATYIPNTLSYNLYMTGPRLAQYYMGNSNESDFEKIYIICNLGEEWVDTDANVAESFKKRYNNANTTDYITQSGEIPKLPSTINEVHPDVHYRQMGYNELGIEAARNLFYQLYPEKQPLDRITQIKLVSLDGITELRSGIETPTNVIPIVSPLYKAKGVTVKNQNKKDLKNFYAVSPTDTSVTVVVEDITKQLTFISENSCNQLTSDNLSNSDTCEEISDTICINKNTEPDNTSVAPIYLSESIQNSNPKTCVSKKVKCNSYLMHLLSSKPLCCSRNISNNQCKSCSSLYQFYKWAFSHLSTSKCNYNNPLVTQKCKCFSNF